MRRQYERAAPGRQPDPRVVELAVEAHWALILEAYRRGVRMVQRGLHRAEGLDHEMVDQALDFALRDMLGEDAEKR